MKIQKSLANCSTSNFGARKSDFYNMRQVYIIPDGEKIVVHDTFGREKISPQKIFDKIIEIVN